MQPQLVLHNGRITTLDPSAPDVAAIAISDGKVSASGSDADILRLAGEKTQKIDLNNRRVIPGLNDSHLHVIPPAASSPGMQRGSRLGCLSQSRARSFCIPRSPTLPSFRSKTSLIPHASTRAN